MTVGVEVKSLSDLLHCITDGRFAGHQLPGLVAAYDQPWLLVEGSWRAQRGTGLLQYLSRQYQWRPAAVGSRNFMYRDLASWLFTIRTKTGVLVDTVPDWDHASVWIATLYSWWTRTKRVGKEEVTGWEGHTSHRAISQASNEQFWQRVKQEEQELTGKATRNRLTDHASLLRPTVCRMVAAQLPGVGYARSQEVAKRFPTVAGLVAASEKEISEVEGIGKLGARKIWQALHS